MPDHPRQPEPRSTRRLDGRAIPLTQLERKRPAAIACMRALDPSDQDLLCAMGLHEQCVLRSRASSSCCVVDIVGACRIAIDRDLAERILVCPCDPAAEEPASHAAIAS